MYLTDKLPGPNYDISKRKAAMFKNKSESKMKLPKLKVFTAQANDD
jgi:hypothetical protein